MNTLRLLPLILLQFSLLAACAKIVDDADFFEPELTDSYLLDDFSGETDFTLDFTYRIDANLINEISFESSDGNASETVYGIYVGEPANINQKTVILYLHDKQGHIDHYWPRVELLASIDPDEFDVLIIDYQGYGKSGGSISEDSLYTDTKAAIQWLKLQGLQDEKLILYGYGLGAALAIDAAVTQSIITPALVIAEAPFASIELLAQDASSLAIPGSFISNLVFDSAEKVKNMQQPLLWFHGKQDEVYSIDSQGQILFNNHPGIVNESKRGIKISGANHHNIPSEVNSSYEGYRLEILTFIYNNR